QCGATPTGERLAEKLAPPVDRRFVGARAREVEEAGDVNRRSRRVEPIAAADGRDLNVAVEQLAQLRHVGLNGVIGPGDGFLPEVLDDPMPGENLARVAREQREHPAPLVAADSEGSGGAVDLEWTQDAEVHGRLAVPPPAFRLAG